MTKYPPGLVRLANKAASAMKETLLTIMDESGEDEHTTSELEPTIDELVVAIKHAADAGFISIQSEGSGLVYGMFDSDDLLAMAEDMMNTATERLSHGVDDEDEKPIVN